jgi:hypothetical protein
MKNITKQIREKIFANYYGQKVLFNGTETVLVDKTWNWMHPSFHLSLNPISKITDEDAIEMAKMFGNVKGEIQINRMDLNNKDCYYVAQVFTHVPKYTSFSIPKEIDGDFRVSWYQHLQSKGYALPYMDYSINDLVELGIYKLK